MFRRRWIPSVSPLRLLIHTSHGRTAASTDTKSTPSSDALAAADSRRHDDRRGRCWRFFTSCGARMLTPLKRAGRGVKALLWDVVAHEDLSRMSWDCLMLLVRAHR